MTTPDLRTRLMSVITDPAHQSIRFEDPQQAPIGSIGYFTNDTDASISDRPVMHTDMGWLCGPQYITPGADWVFVSTRGPANRSLLADMLHQLLVPEQGMLVSFGTEMDSEVDYEAGYTAQWCDLASPQILGHNLDDDHLAHLYYAIEQFGGLQECEAYPDLDKLIGQLSQEPASRVRSKAAAKSTGWLMFEQLDQLSPSAGETTADAPATPDAPAATPALPPDTDGNPVRGQRCPRCRRMDSVVYNGNYWCTKCPWVMGETGRPQRIVIAYLRQERTAAQSRGNADRAATMQGYLDRYGA